MNNQQQTASMKTGKFRDKPEGKKTKKKPWKNPGHNFFLIQVIICQEFLNPSAQK